MMRYKLVQSAAGVVLLFTSIVWARPALTAAPPGVNVEVVRHVAKNPAEVPPPLTREQPETVTINLVAKEVVAELSPGKKYWFWGFAEKRGDTTGPCTVPGPMIRVMKGDTVVINLTNELQSVAYHNLDFHAGFGAMLMDVAPGATKTLTFKPKREGAYIYHCGAEGQPWAHVANGMYGLIMVEPRGGLAKVDREFYLGQSEWYLKPGIDHHSGVAGYSLDEEKALAERPDCFTLNGHTDALRDPLIYGNAVTVNSGESVRIFFVTGGPNLGSNFHIIGAIFDRVYPGHHESFIANEETVHIPPGAATVLEFRAMAAGNYLMVDHALFRVARGARGLLHVR